MAAANKTLLRAAHAWRLVVVGAIVAGGAQLARQQGEISDLKKRLDAQAPSQPLVRAADPVWDGAAALQAAAPPAETFRGPEDVQHRSEQHYLAGVIFYQKGDYDKARSEWLLAKQDDPSNEDVASGLQRVETLDAGDRP